MLKQIVTYFDDENSGMAPDKDAFEESAKIATESDVIVKLGYNSLYYGTQYVYVYPGSTYEDYMKDRTIQV